MNRLKIIAATVAVVVGAGAAAITASVTGTAEESPPETAPVPTAANRVAEDAGDDTGQSGGQDTSDESTPVTDADGESSDAATDNADAETMNTEQAEESDTMSTSDQSDEFKQTMHEGDVALGVCGARVSTLLWFYEASVAQGREDLQPAVDSLKTSRDAIKAEAERRAVEDKVDTSVRVMNAESEQMWETLNEKAGGDAEEFQKAHDELYAGVQECLSLFFERPGDKAEAEADKEG